MDWDNDGHFDILSGCYWTEDANEGQIQYLAGSGGIDFAESKSITDEDDVTLANVEVGEDADPNYDMQNICTHQHAVDYDGDLDLVVGCIGSEFFLFEDSGEGSDDGGQHRLPRFGTKLDVTNPAAHAGPHLVDWDGDGDLDLLSGSSSGGAFLSENVGTRQEPAWKQFVQLIPGSTQSEQNASQPIVPSQSTRVWATDWNGDGLLDLLVGDSVALIRAKDGISERDFERRLKEYHDKTEEAAKRMEKAVEEFGDHFDWQSITEEQQAKLDEASKTGRELYESRDEFMESTATGHVWVYLRKAKAAASSHQVASDR